jgi:iron complex outermembrane recepter protein
MPACTIRPIRPLFRHLFLVFLALTATAAAAPVKFDIPAQSAAAALIVFSKQSGFDVLYSFDDLQAVRSHAVVGDYEPDDALAELLSGTSFTATRNGGKFVVVKAGAATGGVRGTLSLPSGDAAARVTVTVWETTQSTATDRNGEFFFSAIAPGTYRLVAKAEGYQPLHITDVTVRANREVALGGLQLRAADEVTKLQPVVVRGEVVEKLDPYDVEGRKVKPFAAGNMDISRTINDVQPYTIFDAKTIDQSGAVNVEDFLKQRLTMNAVIQTNGEQPNNILGNTSSINLRGVGTGMSLILVDGRRMSGVSATSGDFQPDLNGIPLSAIDRIEVLPSSASGIYGGSAIGGVVNVILKRNYRGGEVRVSYDNYFKTDAARRTASLNYGFSLEEGKTHVTLNAAWADTDPLLLQDQGAFFQDTFQQIERNSPTFIYSSTNPWLGNLPNITPSSASATTLTLKDGTVLNARNTYVPAGTSATTSAADLAAGLLANAGKWDTSFPLSTQSPSGLLRVLGLDNRTRSLRGNIRRQMLPNLELFAEFAYAENNSASVRHWLNSYLTVPASSPVNPFTTDVRVRVADASDTGWSNRLISRSVSLGALAQLPANWSAALDFTWSDNRYINQYVEQDSWALAADLQQGKINPFVDTLASPLDFSRYYAPVVLRGTNQLSDLALRASGPLPALPWGQPTLTTGLEHRDSRTPEGGYETNYPITTAYDTRIIYYQRQSTTDSAYAEAMVPLVKTGWIPGLRRFDLQMAGRRERFRVDTGTALEEYYPNQAPPLHFYSGPTLNGQPYFSKTTYASDNYTLGFRYQPAKDVTLRASQATAFLPPTQSQLVKDPLPSTSPTTVTDPRTGEAVSVYTLNGGNPDVTPQSSRSRNVGLIWEPSSRLLQGLRLNVEYYKIEQFDAIGTLSAQQIVNMEALYPGRVVRDAGGIITQVDVSALNLYHRETEGWDLSVDYGRNTAAGQFTLSAVGSIIQHLKNQYSLTQPEYEAVGFPSENGAARYKSNLTLAWERQGWSASWTTRYFGSYRQYGAAGGPYSLQAMNGAAYTYYIEAQGGDTIPAQTYHDFSVGYRFRERKTASSGSMLKNSRRALLSGLSLQLNVRNVFDTAAPLDVFYSSSYYSSPYAGGLTAMRSYLLTLKKEF